MARTATVGLASAGILVVACAETDVKTLGYGLPDGGSAPTFVDPDAGPITEPGDDVRAYCPSDRCPPGHTTCLNSKFLCDVDLLTDADNCGECGNSCRTGDATGGKEVYTCVDGRCVMTCWEQYGMDCDGVPDNGCETPPSSNDHCGVCGNKCAADKPCINRGLADWGCGCRAGDLLCPHPLLPDFFPCVDPENDDAHCGACNNACPRKGDGSETPPPNMYFGCADSRCGTLKCNGLFGDCDGVRDNGCEQPLVDDDNCGTCGNKCPDGQRCNLHPLGFPYCGCPEGQTFCGACSGGVCRGLCADLIHDDNSCGSCGARCPLGSACVYGKCESTCRNGWADCNGNRDDGCETHVAADPKNCGGCGITCDGIAGQACVNGHCMVEPCDVLEDAGAGGAR